MKIIGRTLAILLAALAVAGATFAFAGSSSAAGPGDFPARGAFEQAAGSPGGEFQPGNARGGYDREHERPAGLFGAVEILKNLAIVGVIVALVAPVARLARRRGERTRAFGPAET